MGDDDGTTDFVRQTGVTWVPSGRVMMKAEIVNVALSKVVSPLVTVTVPGPKEPGWPTEMVTWIRPEVMTVDES